MKTDLFRETHTPQTECGLVSEGYRVLGDTHSTDRRWPISEGEIRVVSFHGLGNSNYWGEEVGISRNWATAHFLASYGQPSNCPGAGGCVI